MRSGWNGKNMFVELRAGFDTDEVVNGIRKLFVHGDYTVIVNLNNIYNFNFNSYFVTW